MAVSITRTADPAGVNSAANVATYSAAAIGVAAADRVVAVVVTKEVATVVPLGVTIGGVQAAAVPGTTFASMGAWIFHTLIPAGTTADILVTWSGAVLAAENHISVYRVIGADTGIASSGTHTSTDMDVTVPLTLAIVVPTDGGALAVACGSTASTAAKAWANITEDLEVSTGNYCHTTAIRTTAGSVSITCTGGANGEDGALACVVFNPASGRQTLAQPFQMQPVLAQ